MKEPQTTSIVFAVGVLMVVLGYVWSRDPANIGAAALFGLGLLVTTFSGLRLGLLLLRRKR